MHTIVAIDVETTGLDPQNDYIVQLSAIKFNAETFDILESINYMILPQHKFTMTPGALRTHGYTEEFIKDNGVYIKDIADCVIKFIGDSDYLTYNGNNFDFKFLVKDFKLAGYDFPIENRKFYDSYAMECKFSPRDLNTVYKNYMGESFENAHDSFSDVQATIKVFQKQIESYGLSIDEISGWKENNLLSIGGSIRYAQGPDTEPLIVFAVGKYKDSDVYKIMKEDPSYCRWWATNVASERDREIVKEYCKKLMSIK